MKTFILKPFAIIYMRIDYGLSLGAALYPIKGRLIFINLIWPNYLPQLDVKVIGV